MNPARSYTPRAWRRADSAWQERKRTFILELVSDDGASFSAKDDEERRTMGCTTEAVLFRAGKKVHLQERGKGTHSLHKTSTGDDCFLMVDAGEEVSGSGSSAERPGGQHGGPDKDRPIAMMTAAELLKSAGATQTMVEGAEDVERGGAGPDGKHVQKYGYGRLTLGANWADMDEEDAHYASSEQMAEDVAEAAGASLSLGVAGPTTVSADVLASMLTTQGTRPAHGHPAEKFYLGHLLPLVVDGSAVDVCFRCFKEHEIRNPSAPRAEVRSDMCFSVCCKHCRHCANERIPDCKQSIAERASATAQKLANIVTESGDEPSREASKIMGVAGLTLIIKDSTTAMREPKIEGLAGFMKHSVQDAIRAIVEFQAADRQGED